MSAIRSSVTSNHQLAHPAQGKLSAGSRTPANHKSARQTRENDINNLPFVTKDKKASQAKSNVSVKNVLESGVQLYKTAVQKFSGFHFRNPFKPSIPGLTGKNPFKPELPTIDKVIKLPKPDPKLPELPTIRKPWDPPADRIKLPVPGKPITIPGTDITIRLPEKPIKAPVIKNPSSSYVEKFIGRPYQEAVKELNFFGIQNVRVLSPNTVTTLEFISNRVNFTVDASGNITGARVG